MTHHLPNAVTSMLAALALSSACGGRELSAGSETETSETGSADTGAPSDPLSCEGSDAPTFPIPLVEGEMQPAHFVRVGERIYWADGWDPWGDEAPSTTLYRTEITTNDPWIVVAEEQPGIHQIVSDGEFVD